MATTLESSDSTEQLRAIVTSLPQAALLVDREDRVVTVNQLASKVMRTGAETLSGRPLDALLKVEVQQWRWENGRSTSGEVDGQMLTTALPVPVRINWTHLPSRHGRF